MRRQVRIEPGGLWHRIREGNGGDHTACGKPIPSTVQWTRDYKLDALICYDCFTPHEVETGETRAIEQETARYPEDLPASKRPSTEERWASRRARRDTERDLRDTDPDLPASGIPASSDDEE